jgi:hypothetical protein
VGFSITVSLAIAEQDAYQLKLPQVVEVQVAPGHRFTPLARIFTVASLKVPQNYHCHPSTASDTENPTF